MSELSQEQWNVIRRAKEKLVAQLGVRPEISLIDIGVDPTAPSDQSNELVLRVHLRNIETHKELHIPEQIDGIRVVILSGNYQLE